MRHARIAAWTHLVFEELEPRSMLAVIPLPTGSAVSAPAGSVPGNGALLGGGFPGDIITSQMVAIGASSGLAAFGSMGGFGVYSAIVLAGNSPTTFASSSPNATDGIGQMTIANGANTPGMGATATNGFYADSGGTGGPVMPRAPRVPPPEVSADWGVDFSPNPWAVDLDSASELLVAAR